MNTKFFLTSLVSHMLCLAALYSPSLFADKIQLNNGRFFSGAIKNETATHVTLDIGGGTISLRRSSIQSISKEDSSDNSSTFKKPINAITELNPPNQLMDIALAYKNLIIDRLSATQAHKNTQKYKRVRANLIAQYKQKMEQHSTVAHRVNSTNPNRNLETYNNFVFQQNQLTNQLNAIQNELTKGFKKTVNDKKMMTRYLSSLENVKDLTKTGKSRKIEPNAVDQAKQFWEKLETKLALFDAEFKRINIAHRNVNGHMIIKVRINNHIEGNFLLDTGATYVTLTPEMANRLHLDLTSTLEIPLSLADNSVVNGNLVVLNSMQIGDIQADRVPAIVLDSKPGQKIDGLLGMSFLRDFVINIDPANKKLVFKKFQS